jgi:hypothetical protein
MLEHSIFKTAAELLKCTKSRAPLRYYRTWQRGIWYAMQSLSIWYGYMIWNSWRYLKTKSCQYTGDAKFAEA